MPNGRVGYVGWNVRECGEVDFNPPAWCLDTRNLPWILKNSMGSQNFMLFKSWIWGHFRIPCKKLIIGSVPLFQKFEWEHSQNLTWILKKKVSSLYLYKNYYSGKLCAHFWQCSWWNFQKRMILPIISFLRAIQKWHKIWYLINLKFCFTIGFFQNSG